MLFNILSCYIVSLSAMNKNFRHIFVALLAGFVFLVGSGVNYTHYCCSECSKKGIQKIVNELCQARTMPVKASSANSDDCCAQKTASSRHVMSCNHAAKKNCCTVTRLQIDLNDQAAKVVVTTGFSWEAMLAYNALSDMSVNATPTIAEQQVYPPPLYSSRHLLCLKSVLLI